MNNLNHTVEYGSEELERWRTHVPPKSWKHLQNSMSAMNSANAGIPTIPLYGKKDVSVVVDYYKFAHDKGIIYPDWQLEYELSKQDKFGEQGGRSSWSELKPDCEMYVLNVQPCIADSISETEEKYYNLHLKIPALTTVLNNQKKEDKIQRKASSWSRFDLKKDDPMAQDIALHYARTGEWRKSYAYFFSYIRKRKNRIFVPAPFCVNLLQAQYHDILLEAIQEDILRYGDRSRFCFFADKIGFYNLWPIMASKSKGLDPNHIVYVVRDFFHMDTTMGEQQKIKHYCNKVAAAFNLAGKSRDLMEEIMCFSNRMPIFTPDGPIMNIYKGEASGATVTNQGESFDNEDYDYDLNKSILSQCQSEGIKIYRIDSYGNGDDGISRYYLYDTSKFDRVKQIVEEQADVQCARYGHMKNKKWSITLGTFGVYCQYELFIDDKGKFHAEYPVSLAINAVMHPMHEIPKKLWDSDYYDWRRAEILAHLYGRDDFEVAIDYVDNGLKRGLFGKTQEDFNRIFLKYKKYRALRDSENTYNEMDPRWEQNPELNPVIKYIKSKRFAGSGSN